MNLCENERITSMRHRTTYVLLVLFFIGLCAWMYLDYAHIPGRVERQIMANRLLPELIDKQPGEITKVEVERPAIGETLVVERVEGGRWQMRQPVDIAADSEIVETLVRNLKDLAKSVDAGTIDGDAASFGLAPPLAKVKLFLKGTEAPITLDVGKTFRERLYVRPGAGSGVEVVDPRLLSVLSRKAISWRDTVLLSVPSFRVEVITIEEKDPQLQIQAQRDDRRWRLVKPISAPADDDKLEGILAELSALRVADKEEGFVEDNVLDLARFGLDLPFWKISVAPFANTGKTQTVLVGNAVPGKPDQRYAMRGDQDDIVRVDIKRLQEAIPGLNGLRNQKVLDFQASRATRLQIESSGTVYDLARTSVGWRLLKPVPGPADSASVQALLLKLSELRASEFLAASQVTDSRLDTPRFRIRVWQPPRGLTSLPSVPSPTPEGELKVDLSLGRDDLLKKSVYGRIHADPTILAFPEEILKELPRNAFAYRDRIILSLKPEQFSQITVERGNSSVTLVPNGLSGQGMKSRMTRPIGAPTDEASVTSLLLALANLRAESWESDTLVKPELYGLDSPWLRVHWKSESKSPEIVLKGSKAILGQSGTLRLGKLKPGAVSFYANLEGDPRVFVVSGDVAAAFEVELHDRTVFSFKPETTDQITIQWPSRTVALKATPRPGSSPLWNVLPGYDSSRFDTSNVGPLLSYLGDLKTSRYLQYAGLIAADAGMEPPRLTIRVRFANDTPEAVLRIGNARSDGLCFATTVTGGEGSVFLLAAPAFLNSLLNAPGHAVDLPDDPFAPGEFSSSGDRAPSTGEAKKATR